MLKNYVKIAWRNLWKSKTYSFLNIFGLAVGIACASLIFLWVEDEMTFDDYFPDKDNLHIVRSMQTFDGGKVSFTATSGLLGPALETDVPEIENTARVAWSDPLLFSLGDKALYERGNYADPAVVELFSLKFIDGDSKTALDDINSVVISESMAKRFFNETHVVGKMLKANNTGEYQISGVFEDLPLNTTYSFDWLVSLKNIEGDNPGLASWGNNSLMTFVRLKPEADLAVVNKKIFDFIEQKTNGESTWTRTFLYPMDRWHLYSSFDKNGNEQEGAIKFVRLFGIIAWVVLLIACINFMNLSTARSEKRAKEVGVRKVVGSGKSSLRLQFITEALLVSAIATLLAVFITWISLNSFNSLVGKELALGLHQPSHLLTLLFIVLVCGFLAGSYPAFYLSSFNPITVLKGFTTKVGSAGYIRKGLVVLQFSASIALIICTIIIFQQIKFVKGRDLGFQKEQVISTAFRGPMKDHLPVLKEQLLGTGSVESIGLSSNNVLNIGNNSTDFSWDGKDPNQDILVSIVEADEGYVPTLGMELIAGRNYHANLLSDSSNIIINEAFAKLIQPDGSDVVGKTISSWDPEHPYTIMAVIKDFVYNDMYSASEPLILYPKSEKSSGILYIRLNTYADMQDALSKIEQVIKVNNPGYPFEYKFLDEQFDQQFRTESMIQHLATVFGVLSIMISCLGLFGLASFTAERRTKEIGVRKVLGASVGSLSNLLSKEFIQLVLISCGIAFPIAWLVMAKWLKNYNYHTEVHWWVFVLAGAGALIIALATVSSQAIRAAVANPVNSLRDE